VTIERLDPSTIGIAGGDEADVRRFIESDYCIRQGLCPNGHGLMTQAAREQECPVCQFTTNKMPDAGTPS
jgi:hypothetical protein